MVFCRGEMDTDLWLSSMEEKVLKSIAPQIDFQAILLFLVHIGLQVYMFWEYME